MDSDEALKLLEAYDTVFATPAGILILRDLAEQTGFMSSMPVGTSPEVLIEHNAGRRFFGRLYEILSLTEQGREALAVALSPASTKE